MLRRSLTILVPVVLPALVSASTLTAPYIKMNFDQDFRNWETMRLVGSYSGTIVNSPVRKGKGASRFELRGNDFVSDGYRAEVRDHYFAKMGYETWYGFSTLIPTEFPIDDENSCVLTQWHDQVDWAKNEITRSPPLAIRYREGRLDVTLRHSAVRTQLVDDTKEQIIYSEPDYKRGVWQDFVWQIKWSFHRDGLVRAWKNGKMIIDYHGPVGYNDDLGPYLKMGVYCRNPVKEPHVIYHDEYARGSSYQQVDPANDRRLFCDWQHESAVPQIDSHWNYLGVACEPASSGG